MEELPAVAATAELEAISDGVAAASSATAAARSDRSDWQAGGVNPRPILADRACATVADMHSRFSLQKLRREPGTADDPIALLEERGVAVTRARWSFTDIGPTPHAPDGSRPLSECLRDARADERY